MSCRSLYWSDTGLVRCVADVSCVEETDCLGRTAVFYAVQFLCLDTLQLLLEHGANVNAVAVGQFLSRFCIHKSRYSLYLNNWCNQVSTPGIGNCGLVPH